MAVVAAIISLACVLAGLRRMWLAVEPGGLDAELLARAVTDAGALQRLHAGLVTRAGPSLESDLLGAACDAHAESRGQLIDEQVIEADWLTQRWAPVPRVCASIATSAGFLCACMLVIQNVTADPADAGTAPSLLSALGAVALGVAGASFCISVHIRLRPLMRARRAATTRLVERLRGLAAPAT